MFRFISIRLAQAIPVLLIIYTITFFMVKMAPGGPFSDERKVAQNIIDQQNAYYGYDDPTSVQFFKILYKHITLDLPPLTSYPGLTAADIIAESLPVSLELGVLAICFALILGIPTGIIASAKKNSLIDHGAMSVSMLGICLPTFVIGPLLALVFSLWLGWLNSSGWFSWSDRILPALTLGLYYAAYISRMTRGGMLEVLNADYIRTARAKGNSETTIILKHALRGGIMPVVSFLGPALAGLISGSFVVETLYQIPGLGRHFIQAAINRDHFLILSTVLLYATLIIVANLIVDLVQVILNPKLKYQ